MDSADGAGRPPDLRNVLPIIASLAIAAGAIFPAAAQGPGRGETVRERARLDYDVAGIRSGGLLILPSIEMGCGTRTTSTGRTAGRPGRS